MADYIDRKEFIRIECGECDGCCNRFDEKCVDCEEDCRCNFMYDLVRFPAADVAEVRHGRWERVNINPTGILRATGWVCTSCNRFWYEDNTKYFKYCPGCGAKMARGG